LIKLLKILLILLFEAIPEISNPSNWSHALALVYAGVVLLILGWWYNYLKGGREEEGGKSNSQLGNTYRTGG
jgi:hypothetical protein